MFEEFLDFLLGRFPRIKEILASKDKEHEGASSTKDKNE